MFGAVPIVDFGFWIFGETQLRDRADETAGGHDQQGSGAPEARNQGRDSVFGPGSWALTSANNTQRVTIRAVIRNSGL